MKKNYSISLLLVLTAAATSCTKTEIASSTSANSVDNSSADVPRNTLVAWYTFNGDVLDHSDYGNNINFNNATAAAGKDGTPNTAYYFDGKSNYMTAPNSTSLNPMHGITMAAVIKVADFYQGTFHANRILQKGANDFADGNYLMQFSDYRSGDDPFGPVVDSNERFTAGYGDNQYNSIGVEDTVDVVKKNRWYTIVYTVDTNKVGRLYVNGVYRGSSTNANARSRGNTDPLHIGRDEDPSYPYWFHGVIDEIRIYNRAYDFNAVQKISASMGK